MTENQQSESSEDTQAQPNRTPKSVDIHIGGNVDGNVIVGDNNVIHYYAAVTANIEKHEPDFWYIPHPYPMPPNFTGRIAERAMLTHWIKEDTENRLFILRALGGFGKSALAWHWLTHDVETMEFPKVVFWSFYEGDASFENFILSTLDYLKLNIPKGQRPQVDELLRAMQRQSILLIMDGFERALRAYSSMNAAYKGDDEPKLEDNQLDCVNINAEWFLKSVCAQPKMHSKVLMTTRLTPRTVKQRGEVILGCREVELIAIQKEDAIEFFHKQGVKGTRVEIAAACAPYGYHPLSLRLLSGRILKDFENPKDIVVAQKLKINGDLKARQHHVLEVSYNSLLSHEQFLLSIIACFRAPVELKTVETITNELETQRLVLQDQLEDLIDRGLLHFDKKNKKFDLHPIVRQYTYERIPVADRTAIHTRLLNYFKDMPRPEKFDQLDDLAPLIEQYHHNVQAAKFDDAYQLWAWGLRIPLDKLRNENIVIDLFSSLFPDGEEKLPRLKDKRSQSIALSTLATTYCLTGQLMRSVPLFEMLNHMAENDKDWPSNVQRIMAIWLHIPSGSLRLAESNLRKAWSAPGEYELGYLQSYCGAWEDAEQELIAVEDAAVEEQELRASVGQPKWLGSNHRCTNETYRALRALMMSRDPTQPGKIKNIKLAIEFALRALAFFDEIAKVFYPDQRDAIRAHRLLGVAYRSLDQIDLAEKHLSEALMQNRATNLIVDEANILLDFAQLRYDQQNCEEAKSLAEEALTITERCGYILQGADVNLFLAQYVLEQEQDKAKAKEYAETALKLAYCDGPPYYYKVAYHEAERMLEKLR